MARYLLIVARDQPDLYAHLTQEFSWDTEVEILLDRRRGQRREHVQKHELERRRADRRVHPGIRDSLRTLGVVVARPQQDKPFG